MAELAVVQAFHVAQRVQDGIPLSSRHLQSPQRILCCNEHLQSKKTSFNWCQETHASGLKN